MSILPYLSLSPISLGVLLFSFFLLLIPLTPLLLGKKLPEVTYFSFFLFSLFLRLPFFPWVVWLVGTWNAR